MGKDVYENTAVHSFDKGDIVDSRKISGFEAAVGVHTASRAEGNCSERDLPGLSL